MRPRSQCDRLAATVPGEEASLRKQPPSPERARALAAGLVGAIAVGAVSVALQAIALRESLVVFVGNELVVGVVLAIWHLGVMVGALVGARVANPRPTRRTAVLISALVVLAPVALVGLRTCRLWSGIPDGELMGLGRLLGVSLVTLGPLSALVGSLFPAVCQVVERRSPSGAPVGPARDIGLVYGVEALASLGAGLVLTALTLPALGVELSLTLAMMLGLTGAAIVAWLGGERVVASGCGFVCVALGAAVLAGQPDALGERWRAKRFEGYGAGYLRQREIDTRYQNLVVATPDGLVGDDGPLVLFADGQYAVTVPDPDSQARRAHVVLAQHRAPRRVLLVGGALLGVVGEVERHGVEQLDHVEVDPALAKILSAASVGEAGGALRAHTISADVRRYVRETATRYDLVLVDQPDPHSAMVNRVYTREFFLDLRAVLSPGGCVVVRSVSTDAFLGDARARPVAAIFSALSEVFPYCVALSGEDGLLAASVEPGVVTLEPDVLQRRLEDRQIESRYFSISELPLLLPRARSQALSRALSRERVAPNTDLRPVSYYLNLVLFGHYTSRPVAVTLRALAQLRWWVVALGLAAVGIACALWRRRAHARGARRSFAPLMSIATTGLLGSAESVTLIYAFQNNLGVLYQAVALLVGLFMFGLAGGSLSAAHWLDRSGDDDRFSYRLLVRAEVANLCIAALLGCAALVAAGLPAIGASILIGATLVLGGAGVGVGFVAAAATMRGSVGHVAGAVDAVDCLGAAFGALLTGVVAIPLFGVIPTAALLALLKASSLLIVVVDARE